VYPAAFDYYSPRSVGEALALLARYGDDAKILAGGQSLLPMMKLRIATPRCLIDINRIEGLAGLRRDGDRIVIGALCRHAEIMMSPLIREHAPIMLDAARQTADVQVRNRGTLAGSLAHADPSGDWPAVLMALDTSVTVAGTGGSRTIALGDFIVDAYTTALEPGEMITEVSVGIPASRSGAYMKFEKRAGDFAVASAAVQVVVDGTQCRAAAISLGAVGAKPIRASAAEGALQGAAVTGEALNEAERRVREAADPFADTRGSVEYKRHLAGVMFRRAVDSALARS
jgi:carbon-monoxide dehydrogenase medium subunit